MAKKKQKKQTSPLEKEQTSKPVSFKDASLGVTSKQTYYTAGY
jgi:hypothetical protein